MVSFALFCLTQVWSVGFGLPWFGRCSALGRRVLVGLGLVLFALDVFWCCPLCLTLDWSAMVFLVDLFFYSLVWFKLVCAVCCARAGLVKQHDCGIECSCLSQYVGRGNSIWFGLPGFNFDEVWFDCSVLVSSV